MCDRQSEPISVLIVEDHPVARDGLVGYIGTAQDMQVVGQTGDGVEAVRLAQELLPDVVLMDVVLKESQIDGAEATRRITSLCPNTQVLALSAFEDDNKVFPTLKAGAMGYLLKTSPSDQILDAIRQVAHRHPYLDPPIYRKLTNYLVLTGGIAPGELRPRLTPREKEVLPLLAQGFSNQEIADELVISVKTVKTHVSNILQKLHLSDRTQVRYWAMQQSFTDEDSSSPPSSA
jgi:NarL family two-component system response regulator LiaR